MINFQLEVANLYIGGTQQPNGVFELGMAMTSASGEP
jgi:hypothetical protein